MPQLVKHVCAIASQLSRHVVAHAPSPAQRAHKLATQLLSNATHGAQSPSPVLWRLVSGAHAASMQTQASASSTRMLRACCIAAVVGVRK